jgi:protocatechuate 3,4-dioxygenase beta subunit
MRNLTEATATEAVVRKFDGCGDARLRRMMTSLVTHLHAFIRETEPTEAEWFAAIRFLTDTGHMCDDKRQEFILLSDTLGVSTLVELINNRKQPGTTETSVFGPFWVAGAPDLANGASIVRDGTPASLHVQGHVTGPVGRPVAGALIEVWQTAPNGLYDVQDPAQPAMNLRGRFRSGPDGSFAFRTLLPTSYPIPHDGPVGRLLAASGRHPWRPAHLHFMIEAEGYRKLITALYFDGDPYLDSDAVFGVKDALVVRPSAASDGGSELRYEFGLEEVA